LEIKYDDDVDDDDDDVKLYLIDRQTDKYNRQRCVRLCVLSVRHSTYTNSDVNAEI